MAPFSKQQYLLFTLIDKALYACCVVPLEILSGFLPLFKQDKNGSGIKPIVLVKFTEQGAVALLSSLLRQVAKSRGPENVYVLTLEPSKGIFLSLDFLEPKNVICLDTDSFSSFMRSLLTSTRRLRREDIDIAFDLHFFSFFGLFASFLLRPSKLAKFSLTSLSFGPKVILGRYSKNKHMLALHQNLFDKALNFSFSLGTKEAEDKIPEEVGRPATLAIFPNASDLLKQRVWPLEKWAGLISDLQKTYPDLVIQVLGENRDLFAVSKELKSKGLLERCEMLFSFEDTNSLLKHLGSVDIFVSTDCGPAHFAAMAGAATVTLFGPESPQVFGAPPSKRNIRIYSNPPCSPCFNQLNGCISLCKNNICMTSIQADEIMNSINNILELRDDPKTKAKDFF